MTGVKSVGETLIAAIIEHGAKGVGPAPTQTARHGLHHELIVSIGRDCSVRVTMDDDALRALCARNGLDYHNITGVEL